MSIEHSGEPDVSLSTHSLPAVASSVDSEDVGFTQGSASYENPTTDHAEDEEIEQFDWDSWQPDINTAQSTTIDEVDWDALPDSSQDSGTLPWREKVIGESDWARAISAVDRDQSAQMSPNKFPKSRNEANSLEAVCLDPFPTSLGEPLPASGKGWPPTGTINSEVTQVRLAPWAPFTTGISLAVAMVLVAAAILIQTGRLGLTLTVLTGQVPTSSDAVVEAYLSAISRGDASKALTYLSTAPANPVLLNDTVLSQSNELGQLRVISIKAGSSNIKGAQRVTAKYLIGESEVATTFTTGFSEGQWLIRDDPGRIGVGSLRATGVPLFINGQEIPSNLDSLPAFPGTYVLSTKSPYVDYAAPGTLIVRSSDEAPIIGAVRLKLTETGRIAALGSVESAAAACLAKKELQPTGCPQNIEQNPTEPVMADTISYSAKTSSSNITEEDLRLATVTVSYNATWQLDVKVDVNGTPRDVAFPFTVTTVWVVTFSGDQPIAVLRS